MIVYSRLHQKLRVSSKIKSCFVAQEEVQPNHFLNSRIIINIVHKLISDKNLEKEEILNKLEDLYNKLVQIEDYKSAMIVAISLGNKEYISRNLLIQKNIQESKK